MFCYLRRCNQYHFGGFGGGASWGETFQNNTKVRGHVTLCYNVSNLHHGGSETGLGSRIKYIEAGFSQFGLFVRHTHTSLRDSDIDRLLKRFGIAIISFFTSSTSDISKIFPSWDFMMIYLDYRLI